MFVFACAYVYVQSYMVVGEGGDLLCGSAESPSFLYPRFISSAFAAKKRIEELSAPDQQRSHHPRGMEDKGDKKTAHKRTISEPPKKKVRG